MAKMIAFDRQGQEKLFVNPAQVATVQKSGPKGVAIRFVGETDLVYVSGDVDRVVQQLNEASK